AVSQAPLLYENKYQLINGQGAILFTYQKHEPVPGEPSRKGKEPLQVFSVENIRLGGAICYDYDFPYLAKGFAQSGANIVAVPSSDWRGIDPIHTHMAAFRAVEQGHSILRSTRFGLSAAMLPTGEMVAKMSSFDQNDRIMMANLPTKGAWTLYSVIGDVWIYLSLGFVVWFLFNAWRKPNP
ncbi:MAG: hypothetical protein JNJ57_09970, partial [Saprospiraceae bacterium]|nr:hypothetical protein [Saprospiraceae bacterium]